MRRWRPVLGRAVEAGLPGVSSYVPREVHEIEPGRFDFDGSTDPRKDLLRYLGIVTVSRIVIRAQQVECALEVRLMSPPSG